VPEKNKTYTPEFRVAARDRWASDADGGAGFSDEPPFWPSRVRLTVPDLNHWTSTTARCTTAYDRAWSRE
jgi:hypothetical protein